VEIRDEILGLHFETLKIHENVEIFQDPIFEIFHEIFQATKF